MRHRTADARFVSAVEMSGFTYPAAMTALVSWHLVSVCEHGSRLLRYETDPRVCCDSAVVLVVDRDGGSPGPLPERR